MTSHEIHKAISNGEVINEMLVHSYIADFVKNMSLGKNEVLVFDKPIEEIKREGLLRKPSTLKAIEASGKYVFEPGIRLKDGEPVFEMAIVDLLESLEKGQYKIY